MMTEDEMKNYQKHVGMLQCIQLSLRLDVCLAVSSLARHQCNPREGYVAAVIKMFGCLKKCPKRGIVIDSTDPTHANKVEVIKPDHGNQHCEFNEELDEKIPEPLMKEIGSTIFVDSNHGHDK